MLHKKDCEKSPIAVVTLYKTHQVIILESTTGAFQDQANFSPSFFPFGKAGDHQIRRCQGIAVGDYSFTLGALALSPSGFCNIGVKRSWTARSGQGIRSLFNPVINRRQV
jgi:hypothetical protein